MTPFAIMLHFKTANDLFKVTAFNNIATVYIKEKSTEKLLLF
jgi:hypothetical protein